MAAPLNMLSARIQPGLETSRDNVAPPAAKTVCTVKLPRKRLNAKIAAAVRDAVSGNCPLESQPIYRLLNNRADVNHRYTTSTSLRSQMIAKGWISEGYGPLGVAMCGPTS